MPDAKTITAAVSLAVAGAAVGFAARTPQAAPAHASSVQMPPPAPPPPTARDVMCPTPEHGPFCVPSACAAGEVQTFCTDTRDGGLVCQCVMLPDGGGK